MKCEMLFNFGKSGIFCLNINYVYIYVYEYMYTCTHIKSCYIVGIGEKDNIIKDRTGRKLFQETIQNILVSVMQKTGCGLEK